MLKHQILYILLLYTNFMSANKHPNNYHYIGEYHYHSTDGKEAVIDISRAMQSYPFVRKKNRDDAFVGLRSFSLSERRTLDIHYSIDATLNLIMHAADTITPEEKSDLEETLGLNGFCYPNGRIIHLPIIEKWMMGDIISSRGDISNNPLMGERIVLPLPLIHSTDFRDFGYTIDYGGEDNSVAKIMFGYESPSSAGRSKKPSIEDYSYRVKLFFRKDIGTAIVIESEDMDGCPGNPVIFDLQVNGDTGLSNTTKMNSHHFMKNIDMHLKEGMRRSSLRYMSPAIVYELN